MAFFTINSDRMLNKWMNAFIVGLFYVFAFLYVALQLDVSLFYFVQQPAFLTDHTFISEFTTYPGGIGQYLSLFFEQFFMFPKWGAFIAVILVFLTAFFSVSYLKKITTRPLILLTAWLLPVVISLMVWHNLKYAFSINTQLLITFIALYATIFIKKLKPVFAFMVLFVLAVAVYFVCGPLFFYIFVLALLIPYLLSKEKQQLIFAAGFILLVVLLPFITHRFIQPISVSQAWYSFIPNRPLFLTNKTPWIIYFIFIYFPVLLIASYLFASKKEKEKKNSLLQTIMVAIIFAGLLFFGIKTFNNKDERLVMQIAQAAQKEDWKKVLQLARKTVKYDRMVNFYLNQAFYYTNQMTSNLFAFGQYLGIDGLVVDYPLAGEICMPSSYLYARLGLTGNALRFAYETQTLLPNSPFVLMQIIDCLIVEHEYANARYFLNQLNKNWLYRSFVADRVAFIEGKLSSLKTLDVEKLRSYNVTTDFYTASPEFNLLQLAKHNPNNRMAKEYLITLYLMKNDLVSFINYLVNDSYLNLTNLPKTYQEAVLVYWAMTKEPIEKSKHIKIDDTIRKRFNDFSKQMGKDKKEAYRILCEDFIDTYWLYFAFDNPMVTKNAVKTRQVLPKN